MSFDNSFDPLDIYVGSGPELNYWDDIWYEGRDLPDRPRQDREERPTSFPSAMSENVDYEDSPPMNRSSLAETFGDSDDDTIYRVQPRVNGTTIHEATERAVTQAGFRLFRTDIRHNHWF